MQSKYLLIIVSAFLLSVTSKSFADVEMSKPDGKGEMTVTRFSPGDGMVSVDFEGVIDGYGTVYVSQTWKPINGEKTRGVMSGEARTFLDDGTLLSSPLRGTLRRNEHTVKLYFTDAVSNGAQNFVMWDIDLLSKEVAVSYWELKAAE